MADNPQQLYEHLLHRHKKIAQKCERLSQTDDRLSTIRLIVFLAGVIASFICYLYTPQAIFLICVTLFVGVFIYAGRRQKSVVYYRNLFEQWHKIIGDHIARKNLNWDAIKPEGSGMQATEEDDINLTGRRSLYHLTNTSVTEGGSNRLLQWLQQTIPDIAAAKKRADAIRGLRPLHFFREKLRLIVKSTNSDESQVKTEALLRWVKQERETAGLSRFMMILSGLAATTLLLLGLYLLGLIGGFWLISFFIYIVVFYQTRGLAGGIFDESYQIEQGVNSLSELLSFLETYQPSGQTEVADALAEFQREDQKPSIHFAKAQRLVFWASLSQKNPIVWLFLNVLFPWDYIFSLKLEEFKQELKPRLINWLDALHELEALCALANFGYLNPHYSFANLLDQNNSETLFRADHMGHPLLPEDEKVRNSYEIKNPGDISLITGSNMSGKSTFLRTVAINLKLAMMGAPVDAEVLETVPMRLFTCINISDSLNDGISYFYAEVKRLRELLNIIEQESSFTVCYCVDEIFRGTNNRERLQGSRALIKKLAEFPAVGLVSTHDLELVQLEEEIPGLRNFHFREHIEKGKMVFDYKLHSGPSPTTNALKIMEMEGLPVS